MQNKIPAPSILIVDDIPSNVKLLKSILQNIGCQLIDAFNGHDALALAKQHKPFLILLDIMMPGMDGFEVCHRLKNSPETASSIIIFISAKNAPDDKIRGLSLGAADFITKPYHKEEVLLRIQAQIQSHANMKRLEEAEFKYLKLAENIQEAVFTWHPLNGISYSNQNFDKLIARHPHSSVGLKLEDFIPENTIQKIEKAFVETLEKKDTDHKREILMPVSAPDRSPLESIPCTITPIMLRQEPSLLVIAPGPKNSD